MFVNENNADREVPGCDACESAESRRVFSEFHDFMLRPCLQVHSFKKMFLLPPPLPRTQIHLKIFNQPSVVTHLYQLTSNSDAFGVDRAKYLLCYPRRAKTQTNGPTNRNCRRCFESLKISRRWFLRRRQWSAVIEPCRWRAIKELLHNKCPVIAAVCQVFPKTRALAYRSLCRSNA